MKKYLIFTFILTLASCALPEQQPTAPLDTATVSAYNEKVYSGNTVPTNQQKKANQEVEIPLNKSDKIDRTRHSQNILIMPSVGYYHHHYLHRYYW